MNKQADPNKKHYFKEAQEAEFSYDISLHCQGQQSPPVTIWIMGDSQDDAEIYELIGYDNATHKLLLNPTGKLLTKISGGPKVGKSVLIKIPIEEKLNYFTGGILSFNKDDLTYELEINQAIFKSQARENYRLESSEVIHIVMEINGRMYKGFDISVGGTSLVISTKDASLLPKGSLLKNSTLSFNRKAYNIADAKILNHIPVVIDGENCVKIGIAFVNLAQKIEDDLYIRISTEARGEQMKKQFDSILQKKSN